MKMAWAKKNYSGKIYWNKYFYIQYLPTKFISACEIFLT